MIKVDPTPALSTLYIVPRSIVENVSVVYRDEATNVEATVDGTMSAIGNEAEVEALLSLVEGRTYSFRIMDEENELYRGRIYATANDDQVHSISKDYTIDNSTEGKTYHY